MKVHVSNINSYYFGGFQAFSNLSYPVLTLMSWSNENKSCMRVDEIMVHDRNDDDSLIETLSKVRE